MGKILRGLVLMFVLSGLVILFLYTVNWLPSLREEGFARQYASIEDATRALKLETVVVPTFFPEGITWPPAFILAQKKPVQALVMEFKEAQSRETMLIMIQSTSRGNDAQLQRIRLSEVTEETPYPLKGRTVLLQVGTCDNGKNCSKMAWHDSGLYYTLILMSSPFELIKIAESMIHS